MTIVDSSVWIDYFNGKVSRETDLLHQMMGQQNLGIFDLIITEVLQGFSSNAEFQLASRALNTLSFYSTGNQANAVKSAENYRLLRKKGFTIRKTIDVIIATNCIEYGFSLLHADRDFEPFATHLGLNVV